MVAADLMTKIELFIQNNQLLVAAIVVVGVVLYYLYDQGYFGGTDELVEFERTDLEERVQKDLRDRVDVLGKNIDKPLFYGEMNEVGPINDHMTVQQPDDRSVSIMGDNGQELDTDAEFDKVSVFMFTPSEDQGIKKKLLEDTLGIKNYGRFMIVSNENVEAEDDRVVVDGNVQFERRGGSFCQDGFSTENVINDIVTNETYEAVLESTPDFVDKINEFDSKYSQRRAIMDKMGEMELGEMMNKIQNH